MSRIAIVDDSRLARTHAAACLRKLGHTIHEIDPTSVFDVLKALQEIQADLLIMDYLMPNCPGISLARACRENPSLAGLPIVLLTAHRDEDVRHVLSGLGIQGILHKPLKPAELEEATTRFLAPRA